MAIKNDSLGNLRLLNGGLSSHVNDWPYFNVESPFSRLYLVVKGEAIVIYTAAIIGSCPGTYISSPLSHHTATVVLALLAIIISMFTKISYQEKVFLSN